MKILNPTLMREFLSAAGEELKGQWVLLGGTLLPALGIQLRSTVDIDLVGLTDKEMAQSLETMRLADRLGLEVQVINQAAAFFLRQIAYAKTDLIPLHKGKNATIFRPSVRLYWKLKVARLSEADVSDCVHYLRFCQQAKDSLSRSDLLKILKTRSRTEVTPEKLDLLKLLEQAAEDI